MDIIQTEFGGAIDADDAGIIPIRLVLGIGRNYAEHAHEQGADVPDRPMVFSKHPGSVITDGGAIVIPEACRDEQTGGDQVDFEAELGVVLGRAVKDAGEDEAMDAVLGYCCANDVSARWWQKKGSGGQFIRGKSFDTFCPIGPRLVPASEVPDPGNLGVRCTVSGELMQDGNTSQMIFPVPVLISELSRGVTLPEGTLILTGTPSGVGMARTPPRYLRDGDSVTVEIEGVGSITNPVRNA